MPDPEPLTQESTKKLGSTFPLLCKMFPSILIIKFIDFTKKSSIEGEKAEFTSSGSYPRFSKKFGGQKVSLKLSPTKSEEYAISEVTISGRNVH